MPRLKQQTVSDYKRKFNEIKKSAPTDSSQDTDAAYDIGEKRHGRPSLLPDDLMSKNGIYSKGIAPERCSN